MLSSNAIVEMELMIVVIYVLFLRALFAMRDEVNNINTQPVSKSLKSVSQQFSQLVSNSVSQSAIQSVSHSFPLISTQITNLLCASVSINALDSKYSRDTRWKK